MKKPTLSQKKAIDSTGKTILKSCPGSGKTFVVAKKMIKEMKQWKYKNRGIALLSFTNVAHEEVNKQIFSLSGIGSIDYPHYTGTIDSFLSQFLFLPYGHLIMKCERQPSLIQDNSISITNKVKERMWRGECHKNGCNPLDFYINEDGNVVNSIRKVACSISKNKPCVNFKKKYYSYGLATYKDIIIIAKKILQNYPKIATLLAQKFPMIIIDEAQDTSQEQMEIIDLLSQYGVNNIMLIGDPDQAIYEWRDADPSVFLNKFKSSEWQPNELNENFRCSQKICNATEIFSTLSSTSIACGETANSDLKPIVLRYNNSDKKQAIDYFLDICKKNDIVISPENVAVLVRGKAGLIGKDYSQIIDLWQSQTAKLLSEASYERDYKSLKRAISLVEKALIEIYIIADKPILNKLETDNCINKIMSLDTWRKFVFDFCNNMPSSNIALNLWIDQIKDLIKSMSNKYNIKIQSGSEVKVKTRDKKLSDFKMQPIKNFYAKSFKYEYLNSTIHAVKGRTFEATLLIIDSRGKLTSNMINTKPIESEEIRTAYVAMTRAKKLLVVAIPKTVKSNSLVRFPSSNWKLISL